MKNLKLLIEQLETLTNKKILLEAMNFSNWSIPAVSQLKQEYQCEDVGKGNRFFKSEEIFLKACEEGKITTITNDMDSQIGYRSRTSSYEDLHDLISSYRSYPEFRNEKTLKAIYDGFKTNKPMDLPIVIQFKNGNKRVFSGNTRMDVAFQLGINPKVLLIKA